MSQTSQLLRPGGIPEWTFGDRLRKARAVAGLDQREFARDLGVNFSTLAMWETGKSKPRDIVAIARRVQVRTGIPAAWTIGLMDANEPRPDGPAEARDDGVARPEGFEPPTFCDGVSRALELVAA